MSSSSSKLINKFTDGTPLAQHSGFVHTTRVRKKKVPQELLDLPEEKRPQKYQSNWYVKKIELEETKEQLAEKARRAAELKETETIEETQQREEAEEKQRHLVRAHKLGVAYLEVVGQEFFRLLIPGQPKTRIVRSKDRKEYFVASKEIKGCQEIPDEWGLMYGPRFNRKLADGSYRGLGEITTISLLVNESDLKWGNIALTEQGDLVKFDGDWCFAGVRYPVLGKMDITPKQIQQLPYPGDYPANNWLSVITQGMDVWFPSLRMSLSRNQHVRDEVNRALLKALILPDHFIRAFIQVYTSDRDGGLYNVFIQRRDQMRKSAFQNQDFLNYIRSEKAQTDFENYMGYLENFTVPSKPHKKKIMGELVEFKDFAETFERLKLDAPPAPIVIPKPPVSPVKRFFSSIGNWIKNHPKTVAVAVGLTLVAGSIFTLGVTGVLGAGIVGAMTVTNVMAAGGAAFPALGATILSGFGMAAAAITAAKAIAMGVGATLVGSSIVAVMGGAVAAGVRGLYRKVKNQTEEKEVLKQQHTYTQDLINEKFQKKLENEAQKLTAHQQGLSNFEVKPAENTAAKPIPGNSYVRTRSR